MNRTLPRGDCGDRSADHRRASRRSRLVPCAVRLVGGTEDPGERKAPPNVNPAAYGEFDETNSGFKQVRAAAILALGGFDFQAHLLAQRTADESAYGMCLPACRFHNFLQGGSTRALQQIEDRLGLAALADTLLLGSFPQVGYLGFRGRFGRFLGRAGLLA